MKKTTKKKTCNANAASQNRSLAVVSLGCDKNLVDTEVMLAALAAEGIVPGADPDGADIVMVNTCAFVREAVEEAEQVIGEMADLKRSGRCGMLIVAGCLAQRKKSVLAEEFPEIDLLVGTASFQNIVSLIKDKADKSFAPFSSAPARPLPRMLATPPWRANLKIAEGCSNKCSYCTIPSLRGPYRSAPYKNLIREAQDLSAIGARELVLVAQDCTRYGSDSDDGKSLPDLLAGLSKVDGIHWIRLMYAYPELVNGELVEAMARLPKVCKYIDMPVQHINGDILRAMNRRGGPDAIYKAIGLLRKHIPGICIRTTILTGFPGETKTQFKELLGFMKETRFDRLGAFAFSPEEGTRAAKLTGQVAAKTGNARATAVMELQQQISLEINSSFIGKKMEILVEDNVKDDRGRAVSVGRTYRDAPDIDGVFYIKGKFSPGDFLTAQVTGAEEYDLEGKPSQDSIR